ncbi:MAG TPA: ABC transporter permease [Propionibacteriaceae bacterium]
MTTATHVAPVTQERRLPPALHYTVHSAMLTAKNFGFVIFSMLMPLVLYVVFSKMFGSAAVNGSGTNWSALIMISMAAYGSLGAAMSGGAQLAVERRSGWFRQLSITTLPPASFLWAKAAVIMLIVLPALILVFAAGFVIGGVRAPVLQWLASLGLMWIALIPLAIFGIVIGLWVKSEVVQGVTTLSLLVLAMLGGLWFPAQMMPSVMQTIAHALPSFWLAELGRYPFLPGAAFPWTGVAVLAAWCAGLSVIGALGYRRAAANSKR